MFQQMTKKDKVVGIVKNKIKMCLHANNQCSVLAADSNLAN